MDFRVDTRGVNAKLTPGISHIGADTLVGTRLVETFLLERSKGAERDSSILFLRALSLQLPANEIGRLDLEHLRFYNTRHSSP